MHLVAKGVGHDVGQGVELGAELLDHAEVGHGGHEHGVAAAQKVGHMAKIDLGGQAALVDRERLAARDDLAVGGAS